MTWRTPAEHLAWRHRNGRNQPCDLQAAVILLRTRQASPAEWAAAEGDRLLPTPDTGTSPNGHGRRGGRPGNGHHSGHDLNAAVRALHQPDTVPMPDPSQVTLPQRAGRHPIDWGPYETAIRRHERMLGCPAPPSTETGPRCQPRLTAAFAEWLMGIPGWVTGVAGIPRTAQLRILGNGVVPQQAASALRLLLQAAATFPSDPGQARAARPETAA